MLLHHVYKTCEWRREIKKTVKVALLALKIILFAKCPLFPHLKHLVSLFLSLELSSLYIANLFIALILSSRCLHFWCLMICQFHCPGNCLEMFKSEILLLQQTPRQTRRNAAHHNVIPNHFLFETTIVTRFCKKSIISAEFCLGIKKF